MGKERNPMNNDQWSAIVKYVLGRLEKEASFEIDAKVFVERFKLDPDYWSELLMRRDHPAPKIFEAKSVSQSHAYPLGAIRFERLSAI